MPDADATATVAARVGYPGLLIKAVGRDTSLDYWHYQARFDQGSKQRRFSLMVFGARDLLQIREVVLVGGFEQTAVLNIGKSSWLIAPQAQLNLRIAEALRLVPALRTPFEPRYMRSLARPRSQTRRRPARGSCVG